MTIDQGWTEDPSTLLQQRALVAMADDDLVQSSVLAEQFSVSPEAVGHAFDILSGKGLVRTFERTLAETFTGEAMRTANGKSLVSQWDALRSAGRTKRACMAAMLSWLDAHEGESIAGTDSFAGDVRSYFFGLPFSSEYLVAAARELKEHGLISGTGTWGGPVLRPAITTLGKVVLARHNGDLVEWEASRQASGTTVSVSGSTGVAIATNSPGATQTVTVVSASEQVLNLASALEAMMPILQLEPAQFASATGLVAQLREAAPEAETNPSKVKALVGMVRDVATNAVGGAAGSALFALAEQVAQSL